MLAMAQPKFEFAGFGWIGPGVMLLATLGATPKEAFKTGYIAGLVQQLITLYWLLFIPFPAGAIIGWLALSAYLAIFPGLWCALAWRFFPIRARGDLFDPTPTDHFTETSILQRVRWSLLCACAWVAMEMTIGRFLSGFPWNFLGVSQFRMIPLIQIASITGVYGISFVMVWFACAAFCAGMSLTRHAGNRAWLLEIVPPIAAIALMLVYGLGQIAAIPKTTRTVRMALVQPSIPQNLIFDPNENTNRFNELIHLSELALQTKPQILVWPEAAVPTMLRWDTNTANALIHLATNYHVWAIVGSDDAVAKSNIPGAAPTSDEDVYFYNSSFAISPRGELAGTYRKRLLVIFGEFVPFAETLPFMKYLSPVGENSFQRGKEAVPFQLGDLDVTTSVLICFEDTFSDFAREYAREDTDFLLNITNNGWFGESAAQWQHAATALFRAVENHIPLVRCANNGLTCWVDEAGRLHEVFRDHAGDIYSAGFKTVEVPILAKGQKRTPTFYNRHGDIFGWLCVGLTAGAYAYRSRRSCA